MKLYANITNMDFASTKKIANLDMWLKYVKWKIVMWKAACRDIPDSADSIESLSDVNLANTACSATHGHQKRRMMN